ncbi:MAG TPA: hypothetical protein VJ464_02065 [Blastocatellia bacterium]|nr:hypothetical protein [Blastocatellia bacterium]
MPTYCDTEIDQRTLIGTITSPEYVFQQKVQELEEADDPQFDQEDIQDREAAEELAWLGARVVNGVLIKKACEHAACSHYRCERALRIGGIEI